MAKIRKYKLYWEASESQNISGYKIYWSKSKTVNYDSKFINVRNVTEVTLSKDITTSSSTVMFGIAAIDKDGNESDITTIEKPYQFHIPKAPKGLLIRPLGNFRIVDMIEQQTITSHNLEKLSSDKDDEDDPFVEAIDPKI